MSELGMKALQCRGKSPFGSRAQVKRAIDRMTSRSATKHVTLQAYECPYCNHWHAGSMIKGGDKSLLRLRRKKERKARRKTEKQEQ